MLFKYKKCERNREKFVRNVAKEVVFQKVMNDQDITTSELRKKFGLSRQSFFQYSKEQRFRDALKLYDIYIDKSKLDNYYVFEINKRLARNAYKKPIQ
ncbi:hypothetical protein [Sutcliffiella horikoshii]|uniref:hypothetical protein n=1 Tax=Sutcliffiella horikoshii TaxID=79883 RepID=UPI001F2389CD|nr:hypothetical protein [Sutcliffiella horikoshii]MCG1020783.1 hypothetical protein [Sutcliffiella horikoshii]